MYMIFLVLFSIVWLAFCIAICSELALFLKRRRDVRCVKNSEPDIWYHDPGRKHLDSRH